MGREEKRNEISEPTFTELTIIERVDSIIEAGLYMEACELIDSYHMRLKTYEGKDLPPIIYLQKCRVLHYMEEWEELVKVVDDYLRVYENLNDESSLSCLYSLQGHAYMNMENYRSSICSYEHMIQYSMKTGRLSDVAMAYSGIAFCYKNMDRLSVAFSFYEKAFSLYMKNFNVSRSYLLKHKLCILDTNKDRHSVSLFASCLFDMALLKMKNGEIALAKEYFRMSANCGNESAQVYERLMP
ncbi:MAG: hypothetical protein K2H16_01095 [Prevotella sp.]|nr:hypothetical protein [Prevotella sp.]